MVGPVDGRKKGDPPERPLARGIREASIRNFHDRFPYLVREIAEEKTQVGRESLCRKLVLLVMGRIEKLEKERDQQIEYYLHPLEPHELEPGVVQREDGSLGYAPVQLEAINEDMDFELFGDDMD